MRLAAFICLASCLSESQASFVCSPTKTPFRTLGQRRCDPPQQQQPQLVRTPSLGIEYCSRCNWMLRSAWLGQELLTTFNASLAEVRLLPNAVEAGVFNVTLTTEGAGSVLVWNRAEEGRFPEAKELKQRVRDVLDPDFSLGHSDVAQRLGEPASETGTARVALERLVSLFRGEGRRRRR
ncbi:hypothetical protein EMIHUDRAFT_460560 [Emiliania huxleyi CCMP1516]|uniref:Uncharacterized protein n=3 Tax=Emiliania huxleyi TaxID=2903 RepID=A0A0D3KK22_EMIH1|nr:hypothetical protein EMIHUDRAFT_450621 [Emiliania huxleyi CCMP1516]XP_005788536.1 hypothetical protein EMIHUDRAFT_460560 [Emiliania huxleyi CCMP1516]EOD23944.1 hypothetical protein EMIHUDRAFT_450621 [Emiliania huxleyi CCMP1516]EOD36107.1 hypothetical protein EMIHUDRAFT_460560 [Emiliania huxleyi CCMP1516]|eukprot:XP_005776373.1 hypothetical protein EMIHUDRAFT_450621 [Emiliania huxleyi CCMP1516]